jgi:hypothetical protein
MMGYFGSHGYFDDNKGHQSKLPGWAVSGYFKKIKRYETMKLKKVSSGCTRTRDLGEVNSGACGKTGVEENDSWNYRLHDYKLILEKCGASTRVTFKSNSWSDSFKVDVAYADIKAGWEFEYVEGKGLVKYLDEDEFIEFILIIFAMQDDRERMRRSGVQFRKQADAVLHQMASFPP